MSADRFPFTMNIPQVPTADAGDTSGDKSPSFSASARESASKRRERMAACSGDTLPPCDEILSQNLATASRAPAVTADVTESPEGGAAPDRSVEVPWLHMPTRAPAAVSQRQAFPSFMRRYIDMTCASGTEIDQPRALPEAHFMPRILREAAPVTPPITPSQASPVAAVTDAVTPGSICPTCRCRVPARLSAAERQRAYRQRKQDKLVV
jgi:hypothetical protein